MSYDNASMKKRGAASPWWGRLWTSAYPTLGCEISPEGISLARWSSNSSDLEAMVWKPVSPGAVEASPLRENLPRGGEVRQALQEALGALGLGDGSGPTDAALVIPDQAARLFVLHFEAFPQRATEAIPMVKWRLKKSVPFDIDSCTVSYFALRQDTGWEVVAVVTPQAILRSYEELAEGLGLRPRVVTLSTLAALGLVEESNPDGEAGGPLGVLVAKYSPPWFTTSIIQGRQLVLFRTAGLTAGSEDRAVFPEQVLETIYPSVAYFQDTQAGRLGKLYLCGLGESGALIAEALEQELQLRALPLVADPARMAGAGVEPLLAERHFTALLGMAREQQSA